MISNVGFTGTGRKPLTPEQCQAFYDQMWARQPCRLHLGDCVHADATAHRLMQGELVLTVGHPPTDPKARAFCRYDEEHVPRPYLERNRDIVDESDVLLACPGGFKPLQRSGTWATIRYAVKKGVPVVIIWPDGRTQDGKEYFQEGTIK